MINVNKQKFDEYIIGGDGYMMIFRKKERDDILTNEPYAAYLSSL